jgi:hypothetical protein
MGSLKRIRTVAILFVICACGIPEQPNVVVISKTAPSRPSTPEQAQTVEQAMAAIITVSSNDLRLPVVDPLYVYLYKNSASFAYYGHGWNTLPFDVANRDAFAYNNTINIDLEKSPKKPSALARILAHEYAHTLQYSVGGMEQPISRWISEGFADWFAAKVFHVLNWENYSVAHDRTLRTIIRHKAILPQISLLHNNHYWNRLISLPDGLIKTHRLAFIAVDRLIERNGLTRLMKYFRTADFEQSFQMTQKEFQTEFESYFEIETQKQANVVSHIAFDYLQN